MCHFKLLSRTIIKSKKANKSTKQKDKPIANDFAHLLRIVFIQQTTISAFSSYCNNIFICIRPLASGLVKHMAKILRADELGSIYFITWYLCFTLKFMLVLGAK